MALRIPNRIDWLINNMEIEISSHNLLTKQSLKGPQIMQFFTNLLCKFIHIKNIFSIFCLFVKWALPNYIYLYCKAWGKKERGILFGYPLTAYLGFSATVAISAMTVDFFKYLDLRRSILAFFFSFRALFTSSGEGPALILQQSAGNRF